MNAKTAVVLILLGTVALSAAAFYFVVDSHNPPGYKRACEALCVSKTLNFTRIEFPSTCICTECRGFVFSGKWMTCQERVFDIDCVEGC